MTKGTGSPLKRDPFKIKAKIIPVKIPKIYKKIITNAPLPGKKTEVKKA